eukprot:m.100669 g.100669  ORF g.100669 m.100669 type:complete len:508 (+) comp37094_c0_seq29:4761-6284(+)
MFGGMCAGWKAKKSYEKYRRELDESPRTRRRLLRANIDLDDSDTDENLLPTTTSESESVVTDVLLDFAPFSDTEGRELAVKKGDIVRVLYRTGEWLYVSKKLGAEGYIPAGYCRAYAAPAVVHQYDEGKKKELFLSQQQHTTGGVGSGPKTKKFEKRDRVEALYNFRAEERDDLSIAKGDRLVVTDEQDSDWLWVKNSAGEEGCVPVTYVSICAPPPPPRVKIDRSRVTEETEDPVRNLLSSVKAQLQTADPPQRQFPRKQQPSNHQRSRSTEEERATSPPRQNSAPARRFPPKLQPSSLTPISESESHGSRARRFQSPADGEQRRKSPDSRGRTKMCQSTTRLYQENGYHHSSLNRAHSFQTFTSGSSRSVSRRELQRRLLENSTLRPSDFSFDNISQLLNEHDRSHSPVGTLSAKLHGSQASTSPTHSTISADSSNSTTSSTAASFQKLDFNKMQIEARLRLSHSRLGIHSSQTSIPVVSTGPPLQKRLLQHHPVQDNSWSYSTP